MDYAERTEIIQIILSFVNHKPIMRNLINKIKNYLPYLGLHNAHGLENLQKKLVCVYNAHGLLKKIVTELGGLQPMILLIIKITHQRNYFKL